MKLKVPEKAVIKALKQYLEILEKQDRIAWWARTQSGMVSVKTKEDAFGGFMRLGRVGTPDFVFCSSKGRFCALEAKSSVGKLSPEQVMTEFRIRRFGGIWITARSVQDLEDALLEV